MKTHGQQAAASGVVPEGHKAVGKSKAREERPLTYAHYTEQTTHDACCLIVALRGQEQSLRQGWLVCQKKMALHIW